MRPFCARWLPAASTLTIAALALAACRGDDQRLKTLAVGISKDSVTAAMGSAPERRYPYLDQGQFIEALLYRRPDAEGPMDELPRGDITPVVLIDSLVRGWGWKYWDSVAAQHRIEVIPKQ